MTHAENATWRRAARFASVAFALAAGWFAWELVRVALKVRSWDDPLGLLFVLIFGLPCIAGLAWMAFRLWSRWNASTVRWTVAVVLAAALLWMGRLAEGPFGTPRSRWVAAAVPAAIVIAAILYWGISRFLIHKARLEDPLDPMGYPSGHATRVYGFALALGCSTWMAAFDLFTHDFSKSPPGGLFASLLSLFGPIVLGWGAYKIVMRWMLPRPVAPQLALAPGAGFDVILPPEQQNAESASADRAPADNEQLTTDHIQQTKETK